MHAVAAAAAIPSTPAKQYDTNDATTAAAKPAAKPRRIHSIAHEQIINKSLVLFHVDIETGGEHCGIIQLSAVAHDVDTNQMLGKFNKFVNPGRDAIWNDQCTATHGLTKHHPSIKDGDTIFEVWKQFTLLYISNQVTQEITK